MKILLIYPRFNYPKAAAVTPPLGILHIASSLRNEGFEISFLDLTDFETIPDLEPYIRDIDLAGISITSAIAQRATEVLKTIKLKKPGLFVMAGGPHPTALPLQTLKSGFDAVIIGEGEHTAVELARAKEDNRDISEIQGIAYLEGDEIIVTKARQFIENLDDLPFPARDLIDWPSYYNRPAAFDGIIASRGCPHRCIFCKPVQDKLFGKKIRHRSPGLIMEEISEYKEIWKKYNPIARHEVMRFFIMFLDDMFLSSQSWVDEFCSEVHSCGIDFWWGCQARVNSIREDNLKRMKDAGCKMIAFGVESGSQRILDFLKKDIKTEDTRNAFDICNRLGIATHAYIIIGSPEETKEDLEKTFQLLAEIRPATCFVARATPVPGSYLYDIAIENNILSIDSFDENYDYFYSRNPLKLKYLTSQDLDDFERRASELFPNSIGLR